MGKLGKKARKFAKKNLQSVYKKNRKINSMIMKKRSSSRDKRGKAEDKEELAKDISNDRKIEDFEETCLDTIFSDGDSDDDLARDDSDSDGFLSEDSDSLIVTQSVSEPFEEDTNDGVLVTQNREIVLELAKQKKKLAKLKEKNSDSDRSICPSVPLRLHQDPAFLKYLESYSKDLDASRNEEMYSEDESNDVIQSMNVDIKKISEGKMLTGALINSCSQLVKEQDSVTALTCLLNGYRAACHYGAESSCVNDDTQSVRIQNSETYCNILTFMLRETDGIFRGLLGITSSGCRKEIILELKNKSKWKVLRPLIKSYLRSTLFLLNQVTDAEMLVFSLTRLGASLMFFAVFPSLLRRLVKTAVHLWATGGEALSSCSFCIIRDVAIVFSSDYFDSCLKKLYKTFMSRCKYLEPSHLKKTQLMKNSIMELCLLDVQKAYSKALLSVQKLAKILQHCLQSKKKEAVEKICNWHFMCCIDLWVTFISRNFQDMDLHSLTFTMIQVVNGVAYLFPEQRYLPLKLRCVQWLNRLSSSSGLFIPVASFSLDVLEYNPGKDCAKSANPINLSDVLTIPKLWLTYRNLQDECIYSAIELLSEHFSQWSYHITFPELATIPLFRLKMFYETTTVESFRRLVKRLIDQVEQNIELVQKKRDEAGFSPKDDQLVESFLQLEKSSSNASFTQYYRNVIEKAASRHLAKEEKLSRLLEKKRKQKLTNQVDESANGDISLDKPKAIPSVEGSKDGNKRKKQRT